MNGMLPTNHADNPIISIVMKPFSLLKDACYKWHDGALGQSDNECEVGPALEAQPSVITFSYWPTET